MCLRFASLPVLKTEQEAFVLLRFLGSLLISELFRKLQDPTVPGNNDVSCVLGCTRDDVPASGSVMSGENGLPECPGDCAISDVLYCSEMFVCSGVSGVFDFSRILRQNRLFILREYLGISRIFRLESFPEDDADCELIDVSDRSGVKGYDDV